MYGIDQKILLQLTIASLPMGREINMSGGTLIISREETNFDYYKKILLNLGFKKPMFTALDKDALYSHIREVKPELILMCARFYHSCTPFMMGQLHKDFPEIKMAAFCIGEYPDEIAMYFILNGIKSYITSFNAFEQFFSGLKEIAKGREYVSSGVLKRIELRSEYPDPAGKITKRHREVMRLICSGFKDMEIAEILAISRVTVTRHKCRLFTSLNVRSPIELVRAALTLELVRLEELYFYPRDLVVNPQPDIKDRGKK
jgi:DNA-binding NarL/FixJ family response regulator